MTVYGIVGDIGCGKTLFMTYLGYNCYLDHYTNYANYVLKFPYINIDSLKDISELCSGRNLITLDEGWITADSRKAGSYRNILLSKQVLQSRKQRADVLYTTQYANQIDIRIRQITKEFIIPEIMYWTEDDIPAIIKADYYESIGGFKFKEKGSRIFDVFNTHLLYDTNQRIESTESGEYIDLLTKYKDFVGSKADLTALINIDDQLPRSQAALAAQYIIYKNYFRKQGIDIDLNTLEDPMDMTSDEKQEILQAADEIVTVGKQDPRYAKLMHLYDEYDKKEERKQKKYAAKILDVPKENIMSEYQIQLEV